MNFLILQLGWVNVARPGPQQATKQSSRAAPYWSQLSTSEDQPEQELPGDPLLLSDQQPGHVSRGGPGQSDEQQEPPVQGSR